MTQLVHVPLGDRAYDIHIGRGLLDQAGALIGPILPRAKVAIVTDSNVAPLHAQRLTEALQSLGIASSTLTLPPGEATKSWLHLSETTDFLLTEKVERRDVVIALGGGVIGDLVGFAAAILRRGVRFIQIPTSLLAQVDSSVGGKTGINAAQGKNLIGAFHQPSLVLADIDVLDTLAPRDFLAGYGEVVKYGLLGNAPFFEWLEQNGAALVAGDPVARSEAVRMSCQMKADIVVRDETEQGDRALLNLGHTFCHALEAATGYSDRLLRGHRLRFGLRDLCPFRIMFPRGSIAGAGTFKGHGDENRYFRYRCGTARSDGSCCAHGAGQKSNCGAAKFYYGPRHRSGVCDNGCVAGGGLICAGGVDGRACRIAAPENAGSE
jgi:3-dehydroquinate synthase